MQSRVEIDKTKAFNDMIICKLYINVFFYYNDNHFHSYLHYLKRSYCI